jgi:putative glutamine amidotransferase
LVGSIHDVAVDEVAIGLAVSARCPDGLVEGIESETDDWTAVGLQFLPEPDADDLDLRVFRAFVRAVQARQLQPV